ncbi:FHA domain-containing protein [[Clostridium] colinum]|uniref:FHA domain-containing protein n=1 Tax=[Clostridium] colinum TaxID=36835 RepID=UPI002024874F|nr:FHA domain-containing protein [[Clostridium] colinum]
MNITMKTIKAIDLILCSISLAIVSIAFLYINNLTLKILIISINILIFLIFLYLAIVKDKEENEYIIKSNKIINNFNILNSLTRISLLNEQGNIIKSWDLYGKTSLVIGKDRKNQYNDVTLVDINLSNCAYATLVDVEHAVLNYSNGCWYIEDLDSKNGISIKKKMENKKYKLSPDEPYKLEKEDIIYLGLTELQVD